MSGGETGAGLDRWLPVLRLVAPAYVVLYLGVLIDRDPERWDWFLGLAAALLVQVGGRFPLPVLLGQLGLLAAGLRIGDVALNFLPGFAVLALAELVYRRRGAPLWIGLGCYVVVVGIGAYPYADAFTATLRVALATGVPVVAGEYLRARRKIARQAQERIAESERLRVSETRAARTGERAAIARELHDLLAHHVASMVLRVGVARHVVPDTSPEIAEVLDDVHATGTAALADLRRLVAVLRDPGAGEGPALVDPADLATELEHAVERVRRAGVQVDAELDARVTELDAVRRLVVLRIVQEGLTNVLKHAGAGAQVRVRVEVAAEGATVIEIVDDGGARPPVLDPSRPGHGLLGMRERVDLAGGRFQAGPHERGWRVRAELERQ
ncbi:sensor histidine kinase [Amycolatopsis anabasis]|uniref:sensor histidine kinase n=1 Tax=Amycolatopsis anabasis TaxID=1840409 RepID=UPI00131B7F0E|nr:histidine kinase [Amycolatopsis anabasis]